MVFRNTDLIFESINKARRFLSFVDSIITGDRRHYSSFNTERYVEC